MSKQIHQDIYVGIIIIIVSIFMYTQSFGLDQAALFPRAIIAFFSFFAIIIILGGIKKTKRIRNGEVLKYEDDEEQITFKLLGSPFIVLLIVIGYVVLLNLIGFFPSTVLFMAGFMWYKGVKDWKAYLFTVIGLNGFVYLVFVLQLNVVLPKGILFQ